jgi:hypothetical protein
MVERLTELVQHSFATGEPWEDPFPLEGWDLPMVLSDMDRISSEPNEDL